jgi:beta-lactam-binding protein with PASTA domain
VVVVPDVMGLGVDQAKRVLEEVGFAVMVRGGSGSTVVSQSPAAGSSMPAGSSISLETG